MEWNKEICYYSCMMLVFEEVNLTTVGQGLWNKHFMCLRDKWIDHQSRGTWNLLQIKRYCLSQKKRYAVNICMIYEGYSDWTKMASKARSKQWAWI